MATQTTDVFTGHRVTLTTPSAYDTVLSKLDSQIQANGQVDPQTLVTIQDNASFSDYFNNKTGSFGFTKFGEFNHRWVGLFGVGNGLRLQRIILGNPLIAITMLQNDLDAGLFVPVELLLRELADGGGTQVSYVLPSSLIAGVNPDEKLKAAAQVLDSKFGKLVEHITS